MTEKLKRDSESEMLREIAQAAPKVEWTNNHRNLYISLPFDCAIDASVYQDADGKSLMEINEFNVSPGLWSSEKGTGNGIGTRLLKALAVEAKKMGVSIISGIIYDKAALAVRSKVFGKDNLKFFQAVSGEPVDKTLDQILTEKFEPEFAEPSPQNIRYRVISEIAKIEEHDKKH